MIPSTAYHNEDVATQTPDGRQTAAGSLAALEPVMFGSCLPLREVAIAVGLRKNRFHTFVSLTRLLTSGQKQLFCVPSNLVFTSGQYREILPSLPQRVPQIGNTDANDFGFVVLRATITYFHANDWGRLPTDLASEARIFGKRHFVFCGPTILKNVLTPFEIIE